MKTQPNLSQALHLLNGESVHGKIQQGKVVERLLAEGKTPEQILEELAIRCLTRKPTDKERTELGAMLGEGKENQQALEDVFWALLNSQEFLFNH